MAVARCSLALNTSSTEAMIGMVPDREPITGMAASDPVVADRDASPFTQKQALKARNGALSSGRNGFGFADVRPVELLRVAC